MPVSSFLINSGRNGGISSGSKLSAKIRYGAPESSQVSNHTSSPKRVLLQGRKGIIYHDIMSDIRTPEDVEVAVRRRVMRGFIPEEESKSYVDVITGALADSRVYAWFHRQCAHVHT